MTIPRFKARVAPDKKWYKVTLLDWDNDTITLWDDVGGHMDFSMSQVTNIINENSSGRPVGRFNKFQRKGNRA